MPDDRNMRERIARRLCKRFDRQEREDGRLGGALTAYNAGVGMTIKFWNSMADAILDELRNPTEAMLEAGEDCDGPAAEYSGYATIPADALTHWQAMLDAAAKQERG